MDKLEYIVAILFYLRHSCFPFLGLIALRTCSWNVTHTIIPYFCSFVWLIQVKTVITCFILVSSALLIWIENFISYQSINNVIPMWKDLQQPSYFEIVSVCGAMTLLGKHVIFTFLFVVPLQPLELISTHTHTHTYIYIALLGFMYWDSNCHWDLQAASYRVAEQYIQAFSKIAKEVK